MKRRIAVSVIVFLLAYGGFLFAQIPARWLLQLEQPRLSRAGIRIDGVGGTAWNGKIASVDLNDYHLGRMRWRLGVFSLISGHPEPRVWLTQNKLKLAGRLRMLDGQRIQVSNLSGQLSIPYWADQLDFPVSPRGIAHFDLTRAIFNTNGIPQLLKGTLRCDGVQLASINLKLGDIHVKFTNPSKPHLILGHFNNQGGNLSIRGTVQLNPQGVWTLRGKLKPAASATDLASTLQHYLGSAKQGGWYPLTLSGRLTPYQTH